MQKILLFLFVTLNVSIQAQEIKISFRETPPFRIHQEINVDIQLINNDTSELVYFDSRGPSWESFKEVWSLSANGKFIEVLPLNNNHDSKFTDSTLITLGGRDTNIIRSHSIILSETGSFSLTYSQEQGQKLIQKRYADTTVTDSALSRIKYFKVSDNVKFEVLDPLPQPVSKIINMPWEAWKEFRHAELDARKNHFYNLQEALYYPQEVYALSIYCDGFSEALISEIGHLKNLRSLTLRRWELNTFPKALTELDLFELTIIPKKDTIVEFPYGISKNNTLHELTGKFYNGLPDSVLSLKDLEKLEIRDGRISTLPDMSSLQKLETLIADKSEIESIDDSQLEKLPYLKELNLSGNKKLDNINPFLECQNLEFLVLNRTSITEIPHEIEKLSKLKKLSVSSKLTMVSDSIGNLEDMRYLSFGGNRNLDSIPNSILKMKKLIHLDISSTNIPMLPEGISELPIETLYIYRSACENTKDIKAIRKRIGEELKE